MLATLICIDTELKKGRNEETYCQKRGKARQRKVQRGSAREREGERGGERGNARERAWVARQMFESKERRALCGQSGGVRRPRQAIVRKRQSWRQGGTAHGVDAPKAPAPTTLADRYELHTHPPTRRNSCSLFGGEPLPRYQDGQKPLVCGGGAGDMQTLSRAHGDSALPP